MKRLASTRSERRASQPWPGLAQCRVGSIELEGIRYGFTTHALIARTIAIAPAMVTMQSIAIRHGRGRPAGRRSAGAGRQAGPPSRRPAPLSALFLPPLVVSRGTPQKKNARPPPASELGRARV